MYEYVFFSHYCERCHIFDFSSFSHDPSKLTTTNIHAVNNIRVLALVTHLFNGHVYGTDISK